MAKSIRSKREKRLKALRRELVQPFYDKKEEAKLAAQEAALAAPKLPVKSSPFASSSMEEVASEITASNSKMDVEMDDGNQTTASLKPIGKKLKKKLKLAKRNKHNKGAKVKRRHI